MVWNNNGNQRSLTDINRQAKESEAVKSTKVGLRGQVIVRWRR